MREADYFGSPAYQELFPLRIPAGWRIDWNGLSHVIDDDPEHLADGAAVFAATNEARRFLIDVEYRCEPGALGQFLMSISYQPWPRSDGGRRLVDKPLKFDADAELIHVDKVSSAAELVLKLEAWIARCTVWVREGH